MMDRRLVYVLLAIAALVVLFLVFRPGDDDGPTAATTATTPQAEPAPTEPTTPTTTATAPAVTRWLIDSRDDALDRLSVPVGTRVRMVTIADVTDHVHLHGYDLMADVAPGEPAVIAFTADTPGRFEIELEDRSRQIAQLTVEP
jgi:heme/copper-type cytochrome/quinol oxidase subunit 2